jgi:16S rRNA (cytosine967-C5)-methyltransferase
LVSFSPFLYKAIEHAWSEHAAAILRSSNQRPPMTLRVNLQKTSRDDYLNLLTAKSIEAEQTKDSQIGVTLKQPIAVDDLPGFSKGWVSVQDESAQLCPGALMLAPGLRVLDTCAAPGGKTCAILEHEPSVSVTAVDLPERVDAIAQNLKRINLKAVIHDSGLEDHHQWWDGRPWDRILMDVPCSGTGVIRRHPDIHHHRQPGDLERFATQQLHLLKVAWSMMARGGKLLYVTCSIMPQENDDVIEQFLMTANDGKVEQISGIAGVQSRHGLQRLPGVHNGDGFYFCRLAKL